MKIQYVSHPIFINLYPSVFGFTRTVGNKYDIHPFIFILKIINNIRHYINYLNYAYILFETYLLMKKI